SHLPRCADRLTGGYCAYVSISIANLAESGETSPQFRDIGYIPGRGGSMETGIPGLRGGDHVGITVPDMEQAHAFFVDVLGFDYVYSLPEMRHDDDWMLDHLNVDPRAVV